MVAHRTLFASLAVGLALFSSCASGESTDSSSDRTSPATSAPLTSDSNAGDATTTSASDTTQPSTSAADASTTTLVPAVDTGYELATFEAQRPYITLEGGACDLAQPWSARLESTQGGLSGLLDYQPSGDGTNGSVTVTFSYPGTEFEISGTTSYRITPLDDPAVAVPTTDSSESTTLPEPGDLPEGALRIQYGAITFTANEPGAMIPTLPGDIWGPPLLVPAPRDC